MMKMHNPQFEPMGTYRLGTLLSETFASVQLRLRSILAGTQGAITTDGLKLMGGPLLRDIRTMASRITGSNRIGNRLEIAQLCWAYD